MKAAAFLFAGLAVAVVLFFRMKGEPSAPPQDAGTLASTPAGAPDGARGAASVDGEALSGERTPAAVSGEAPTRVQPAQPQPGNFGGPTEAPPPVEISGLLPTPVSVDEPAVLTAEFEQRYAKVSSAERLAELERLTHLRARVEAGEEIEVKLLHGVEGLAAEIEWLIHNPGS